MPRRHASGPRRWRSPSTAEARCVPPPPWTLRRKDCSMPDLHLGELDKVSRLLLTVPLRPVQGDRFQPTGFPSLGAATYQTKNGQNLLVESAQSMANRMETACWDRPQNSPVGELNGISHVTVNRKGAFLTDSMLEAHR